MERSSAQPPPARLRDRSTTGDGEESEEELEMIEGENNVELSGNSGLRCAMAGDVVPLVDEQEVHLNE